MISREQVVALLKINGLSASATDEEIRIALLSARYSQPEVTEALGVLRGETTILKQTQIDSLHKVFRTANTLKPKEISNLLGIEIDASQFASNNQKEQNYAGLQYAFVWLLAVVFAASGILAFMYIQEVGIFHPTLVSNAVVLY